MLKMSVFLKLKFNTILVKIVKGFFIKMHEKLIHDKLILKLIWKLQKKIKNNLGNPKQSCRTWTTVYQDWLLCGSKWDNVVLVPDRQTEQCGDIYTESPNLWQRSPCNTKRDKVFSINMAGLSGLFIRENRTLSPTSYHTHKSVSVGSWT